MPVKDILLVITMDCERARSETAQDASGPPDYAASARWIEAYARIAADRGFPVTFFIHPEPAAAHPGLFRDLARDGACLGLHLHPWKFGDGRWKAHFGGLTADQQRQILGEAGAIYAEAIGETPRYFRPGTFSANDSTFPVLTELGFRGGSISAPERVYRELCAIWTGAPADPHRGHTAFRQFAGRLDFANMPLSVDLSDLQERNGRRFCRDLRPDYENADYRLIASNIIGQIRQRDPAVPVINIVTHNDNDYTNPNDRVPANFIRSLDAIGEACAWHGVGCRGGTIADVADRVLAQALPPERIETVGIIHGTRTPAAATA